MRTDHAAKLALILALGAATAAPRAAMAETTAAHGAALLQMWDTDSDGSVTLAEVQTRRGDIFTAFDTNGDDTLSPAEMDQIEEMRALQQEEMGGGMGQGQGMGKGQGQGQGKGQGKGMGHQASGAGIDRVSFVAKSADWLARKDQNGDGVISAADFAP